MLVSHSCWTLCDPMDCRLPGSVHEIFQTRILERVDISFSRGSSQPRDQTWVSCIGRQILYHLSHRGSPQNFYPEGNTVSKPTLFCPCLDTALPGQTRNQNSELEVSLPESICGFRWCWFLKFIHLFISSTNISLSTSWGLGVHMVLLLEKLLN